MNLLKYAIALSILIAAITGIYSLGKNAGESKVLSQWQAEKIATQNHIFALEEKAREEVSKISEELNDELDTVKKERDDALAAYKRGDVRLRDNLRPSDKLPEAAGSSEGSDAGSSPGLSDQDVEFLIRIAGEADDLANRLTACQEVLKTEREQNE